MLNTKYARVILAIFIVFSFVSFSQAQAFRCLEAINGTESTICDTAELQSALPAKVCAPTVMFEGYVNIGFLCDAQYDSWKSVCPKKNHRVEDYCLGTAVLRRPCGYQIGCTRDSDCNPIPPAPQITFPQCFYSCQYCFDDEHCEAEASRGNIAPRGNKTCTPRSIVPTCTNGGFVELTTGFCNCLSGFSNNPATPLQLCSVPPSPSCLPLREPSPLDNNGFPSLRSRSVYRNLLRLTITSIFLSGRRTQIEFPNATCNLVNNPGYYNKTTVGCTDQYSIEIPYADCGFIKTLSLTPSADSYRGVMNLKQIDTFTIDGQTVERVVSTPLLLGIQLPHSVGNVAQVEVISGPVNFTVKALFIGQTIDIVSQTAQLTFLTSAMPFPITLRNGVLNKVPADVTASFRLIDQSCSETSSPGFCQQKSAIDLDVLGCNISGEYNMTLQFGCLHNEGCPISIGSLIDVAVVVRFSTRSTCASAFVDVNLTGSLATFNDSTFTNRVSSFTLGERAYFLLSTSADVEIANVTLDIVYISGEPGTYLVDIGNLTSTALNNGFTWGSLSNSQAWFGFDVTVSSPQSPEDTVFKLENNQNGTFQFFVVANVEWNENGGSVKKRMVLEGTTSSQTSQFTSQVQIANTKQGETVSMSSAIVVPISALLLSVAISLLF